MSIKSRIIDVIGAVAIGAALVGCKTVPSVDTMYQCSTKVEVLVYDADAYKYIRKRVK